MRQPKVAFVVLLCVLMRCTHSANTITVAMLQMLPSPTGNQTTNLEKATLFIKKASSMGADIALMPEMWNVGYTASYPGYDPNNQNGHFNWLRGAVSAESDWVQHFVRLAKNLSIAIGITYMETFSPLPRNSIALVDRFGEIVLNYSKVHTCDWIPSEGSTFPGEDFFAANLNTKRGNITVGSMICYDREFPESARILMLKGAELILTPNACILSQLQIDQFKVRGFENAVVVAMANYAAPFMNGWSAAFSANGTALNDLSGEEKVSLATFDIDALRAYRRQTIWGDAFRRPYRYSMLTTLQKQPAFELHNFFNRDRLF